MIGRIQHLAFALVAGAFSALQPVCGAEKHGEFASESINLQGQQRHFRLVVPKTVDLSKPARLVIAFHGILIDSKDLMPLYSELNATAEKYGFILVYPNAINRHWGLHRRQIQSDLAFFDALLQDISKRYKVDSKRIYVLGMSNGGYFAQLIAKERSGTIAAVATHSGPLGLQSLIRIGADRKFPILIINGLEDPIFKPHIFRENRDKYRREGHKVEHIEVHKLGHFWAAKQKINDTIWKFFDDHPLSK